MALDGLELTTHQSPIPITLDMASISRSQKFKISLLLQRKLLILFMNVF